MAEPRETAASNRPHAAGHGRRTLSADRLASLSDTMFGVAMKLLATTLVIYGAHITLLAVANLALWLDVHRRISVWRAIVPTAAAVVMLGSGFAIGLVRPWAAQYIWYADLAIPALTGPAHQAILRLRG